MPSRRDTLWGFLSPISPLFPLAYMLSSWQRLRHTVVSLLGDRVGAASLSVLALSSIAGTFIARDRSSAIGASIALFIVVLLVAYGRWGIEKPWSFLRALTLGSGVLGLVVVLARWLQLDLYVGGFPILADFAGNSGRGNVLGMANNGLGALLEPGVVGGIGLALLEHRRRPLYALAAVLSALGVLVTFSRGAVLGVIIASGLLFVYFFRHLRRYWKLLLVIALAFVVLLATWPALQTRLASMVSIEANIGRVWIWTAAWRMIQDHPLFGSGPGNFGAHYTAYQVPEAAPDTLTPHNLYLYVLSGWGLVGFLAFFGVLGWTAVLPMLRDRSNSYRVVAMLMGLTFWIHVLVDDLFIPHALVILGCAASQDLPEKAV